MDRGEVQYVVCEDDKWQQIIYESKLIVHM